MTSAALAVAPDRLRIASYNIYKANWFERQSPRGGTVLDDLRRLPSLRQADVLLLQEAIVGRLARDGNRPRDTVVEAASTLGIRDPGREHTSFHGTRLGSVEWGVGVICRTPAAFQRVELPKPRWSPWQRGGILARVGPWVVGTVHLEVWPGIGAAARCRQARALLDALEASGIEPDAPVILAGDLNCERGGPHRDLVRAGFVPALEGRTATFRFAGIGFHLDHIYVRGARVVASGVERGARGSDHLPVWAEVSL